MNNGDWFDVVMDHWRNGALREAILVCEQRLRSAPSDGHALFQLGLVQIEIGDYLSAVENLKRAAQIWGDIPDAYVQLGVALMRAKRFEDAASALSQAIELEDDFAEAHFQSGELARLTGECEAAIEHYRRAVDLEPQLFDCHLRLAAVLREVGRCEEAVQVAREVVDSNQTDAEAHYELGNCLLSAGYSEDAEAAYVKAAQARPGFVDALEKAAYLQFRHADWRGVKTIDHLYSTLLIHHNPQFVLDYVARHLLEPTHTTCALAAKTIACLKLGDHQGAHPLLCYERLVRTTTVGPPHGYNSVQVFNKALGAFLIERSSFPIAPRAEPTLLYGQSKELLQLDTAPIVALKELINAAVADYRQEVSDSDAFPVGHVDEWWLQGWGVVMNGEGYKDCHFHPPGWLSGVYYVEVPAVVTGADDSHAGFLELGRPPGSFEVPHVGAVLNYRPQAGELILFPSYLYHRTLPFTSDQRRISFAFNAMPLWAPGLGGDFVRHE